MAASASQEPVDGASSIQVTVRVRPFTIQEAAQLSRSDDGPMFLGEGSLAAAPRPRPLGQKGIRSVIKVMDEKCLIFDPAEDSPMQRLGRSGPTGKRFKDQKFAFDRVFDENTTQNEVYDATTRSLLDSVLDGYNATVFAYGATGCGKTHTISGTTAHPGIIFMTMQELFEKVDGLRENKEIEITLSYLEIYNEHIRDLLNEELDVEGQAKQSLMLREDSNQAISVSGLTTHKPQNVDEVMNMVLKGNAKRTQSPTDANATSSRSHAVLQVNVALKDRDADVHEPVTFATLSIIDLAGSERASATKNRGPRLMEGANINKSLLALGGCINALCDPKKKSHVPYRNSKLTRLLKFSLGGNCRTVMIVCISPNSVHFDETQNTLRYADRAKNIQTKSVRNVYNVDRHVKDYVKKIDEQLVLITELKDKLKDSVKVAKADLAMKEGKLEDTLSHAVDRMRVSYLNSEVERVERIKDSCKLRQIERRISAISAWVGAFDQVCETREDEEPPAALVSMRKTATGILTELEHSRQHFHQRLEKNNWTRAIDTALQNGLGQLQRNDAYVQGNSQEASLLKELEILKQRHEIDLQMAVLEQEKIGESAFTQVMLTTQFETMAIINQLMQMSEEEAMQAGREVMGKLLSACLDATGQIIKPDGGLQITQPVPPTKSGTPRKQKRLLGPSPSKQVRLSSAGLASPLSAHPRLSAIPSLPQHMVDETKSFLGAGSSPLSGSYSSPKRRVKLGGMARKGVTFSGNGTPKKRSPQKKARGVRWKDEDTKDGQEPGSLVEFQPTPKMPDATPPALSTHDDSTKIEPPNFSAGFDADAEPMSSPLPAAPVPSSDLRKAGTGRFANGFLSKTGSKSDNTASPTMQPPCLTLGAFSSEDESSPLRDIGANRAPQPGLRNITNQTSKTYDNSSGSGSASNSDHYPSDVDALFTDKEQAHQIRSAMARKKRSSSMGSNTADRIKARADKDRRRSPTASSPINESSFSAGHARRMVGSTREEKNSVLSPRTQPIDKGASFARPMAIRQRQSMFDLNTPRETPPTTGRPHSRVSSVVPGSASRPKGPWR